MYGDERPQDATQDEVKDSAGERKYRRIDESEHPAVQMHGAEEQGLYDDSYKKGHPAAPEDLRDAREQEPAEEAFLHESSYNAADDEPQQEPGDIAADVEHEGRLQLRMQPLREPGYGPLGERHVDEVERHGADRCLPPHRRLAQPKRIPPELAPQMARMSGSFDTRNFFSTSGMNDGLDGGKYGRFEAFGAYVFYWIKDRRDF